MKTEQFLEEGEPDPAEAARHTLLISHGADRRASALKRHGKLGAPWPGEAQGPAREPSSADKGGLFEPCSEQLERIGSLLREVQLLTLERQFLSRTYGELCPNAQARAVEDREINLLGVCERFLKSSTAAIAKSAENSRVGRIEALEAEYEALASQVAAESSKLCKRKWRELEDSNRLKAEEVRSLELQLDRLSGFQRTFNLTFSEFLATNALYIEAVDQCLRKPDHALAEMTPEDISRTCLIAETLAADCRAKLAGDLAEVRESNSFLASHLREFDAGARAKAEQLASLHAALLALPGAPEREAKPLVVQLAELQDQVSELERFEATFSLNQPALDQLISHVEAKIAQEEGKTLLLAGQRLSGEDRALAEEATASALLKLLALYETKGQAQGRLEAELAELAREEAELRAMARVFDDLALPPAKLDPSRINSCL